jgi:hypothetical protein
MFSSGERDGVGSDLSRCWLLRRWLVVLVLAAALLGSLVIGSWLFLEKPVRVSIVNHTNQPITGVVLSYPGGREQWGQLAPGSRGLATLPPGSAPGMKLTLAMPQGGSSDEPDVTFEVGKDWPFVASARRIRVRIWGPVAGSGKPVILVQRLHFWDLFD